MNNTLLKKLQIKEEFSVLLMNSNPSIHPLFEGVRVEFNAATDQDYDSVILFTRSEEELKKWIPQASDLPKKDGQLWLSYPKKSGDIETDLNRDITWNALKVFGMEPVRLISMNENWSSMRLVKKKDRKKPSKLGQDPPGVDRKTKTVIPPDDLIAEFNLNPEVRKFFDELAFSHKREYVGWIHDAKKEETRKHRIKKTIQLLSEGKKLK
ncbi:MAG: YdeI/OmpD-associated family protein [Balneolaceae bacterium]|nr:YdeI/OmpD-associated family protein [Balneolaceae bacterium]MBO6545870.1 YdeI/OmpD-associated family protein [Balneolaceae bacterium]MBO6647266.1 YdeI/OmpD-associated family protein [Balneolaceae bacterium]